MSLQEAWNRQNHKQNGGPKQKKKKKKQALK